MSVAITPPAISGGTPEEQLKSMQSWMLQLSEQLQYALNNLDSSNFSESGIEQITKATETSKTSSASSDISGQVGALKALIIKTSDTVKAHYDEITETLESDYLATSDFGEYSETAKATTVKNALGVTQYFERTEEIEKRLSTVEVDFNIYVKDTKSYIRTGYIEQLGAYGIEIGEDTIETIDGQEATIFNYFATFTSNELAFWQNGYKVGSFKGNSLFVNGDIRIGKWSISQVDGFAIKYVG